MHDTVDERLAAVQQNWALRFLAGGVAYDDYFAAMARISVWTDWLPAWREIALRNEELAERALEEGSRETAGEAWHRAALCWHFGKLIDHRSAEASAEAQDRQNQCFDRALPYLEPPGEKHLIPYGDAQIAAVIRTPSGPGPHPMVLMLGGGDSTKEEVQTVADAVLRRGMAILAFDAPGHGETQRLGAAIAEPASEQPFAAVLDYAETLGRFDTTRIGAYGASLGGYYVLRAAAFEPRIRAAVDNCGPYCLGDIWNVIPTYSHENLQRRLGASSLEEAREKAFEMDLSGIAADVQCPVLVAHGTADIMVPVSHGDRLANELPACTYMREDADHCFYNRHFELRATVADWLESLLR